MMTLLPEPYIFAQHGLFPCIGAHYVYHDYENDLQPYAYALVIGLKDSTETFLVKIPVSDQQEAAAKELVDALSKDILVPVIFSDLKLFLYQYLSKKGYTGTATSFHIATN